MTLSTRKRLLLAAVEQTYGTAETMAAGDALLVSNLEVTPLEVNLLDRELVLPFFGNRQKIIGQRMGSVSFDVELAGSGTAGTAPRWGRCLRACGFGETVVGASPGPASVTYAPASSSIVGLTLDFNADGNRHYFTGCRGTATFNLTTGEIPKISFEMMGIYNTAAKATQTVPTFANQANPVVVNSLNTTSVSAFSFTSCMESFSLALNNENPFRQLAGCTQQILVSDRAPSGEIVIEAPLIGSGGGEKDFFAPVISQTLGAIGWQHGQTAGNIITFSAPTCNLDGPTYGDSDGVLMLNLPFMPVPTSAGNDEFTLVLT
jgi:hypothetical protein